MSRTTIFGMAAAVVSFMVVCETVRAQYDSAPSDPKPRSTVGGYTGQSLRQLYRSDIGKGYTVDSLNALDLRRGQANVPYVGQSTTTYGRERLDSGLSSSPAEKPFANVSSRPAVSPYMNLFREDLEGNSDLNYQTLVQPQLRQQRENQRLQDQAQAISRRVQQISARPAYDPRGSQSESPTGHQTVYNYYGHYYPGMAQRRR
jgi:hypothetical protein